MPVHAASVRFLENALAGWAREPGAQDLRFQVVYNGRLARTACARLHDLAEAYAQLAIEVTIQPSGHLSGWGSLRRAQQKLRTATLEQGFTHLLFHEVSRVPARRALQRLLSYRKPVIGAIYKDTYHPGYHCVYRFDEQRDLHCPEPYARIASIREPTPVEGLGFGFVLIAREVLAQVAFRSGKFAADTYFFYDLRRLGIPVHVAPVFARNLKVDAEPSMLLRWQRVRRSVLRATSTADGEIR